MYREVTMIELREVLRLRAAGLPKKRIAPQDVSAIDMDACGELKNPSVSR